MQPLFSRGGSRMFKGVRKIGVHVHVLGTGGNTETHIRYSATLREVAAAEGSISPVSLAQCKVVCLHAN